MTSTPITIGSRVRLGERVGVVMAIGDGMARVEWDAENSDLVRLSLLVRIADAVKTGKELAT